MPDNTKSSDAPKSASTPKYIHPIDLLRYRLRHALEEAENLVELTVGNYELGYYKVFDSTLLGAVLRANAYCDDPKKVVCHEAPHALTLARLAAIGIGEWLRYGLGERAGTFETEMRDSLKNLKLWANSFPNLPILPGYVDYYARWKSSLEKAWKLDGELSSVATQSRDTAEWKQALQDALDTILLINAEFENYCSVATDLAADLEEPYAALVAAMNPVAEILDKIGPRLLYGFDDSEELEWLIEHLRHLFAQCTGCLQGGQWRYPPQKLFQQLPRQASDDPPMEFWEAWDRTERFGDYVIYALGGPSAAVDSSTPNTVAKHPPEVFPRHKRTRATRVGQEALERGREDSVAHVIRTLAEGGKSSITSKMVSEKTRGSDNRPIPSGTVRNTKAWKNRERIIKEAGGDRDLPQSFNSYDAYHTDHTPLDDAIDNEEREYNS